ncbi:MAG: hypothetical protein K2H24_00460, partial [Clostridia bacterium]|nr:hypothetical protein [Clostridia bacterium]
MCSKSVPIDTLFAIASAISFEPTLKAKQQNVIQSNIKTLIVKQNTLFNFLLKFIVLTSYPLRFLGK